MKRLLIVLFVLLFAQCFAQQDSLVVNCKDVRITLIYVPGGVFERGCTTKSDSFCPNCIRGPHSVSVKPYYIMKYEVTQELYQTVTGKNPSYYKEKKTSLYPVEMVSWYDAIKFIDTLNKITGLHFRLPTEAEWEYAARGGNLDKKYRFAGSNNIDRVTWFHSSNPHLIIDHGYQWTMPIGGKKPNALGLYDMTGNVSEWCSDWFSDSYYQTQKHFASPIGPVNGTKKAFRGGSWGIADERMMEIRFRRGIAPDEKRNSIGFRLAMDAD